MTGSEKVKLLNLLNSFINKPPVYTAKTKKIRQIFNNNYVIIRVTPDNSFKDRFC